jgi:integrase
MKEAAPVFEVAIRQWIDYARGEWGANSQKNVAAFLKDWGRVLGGRRIDVIGIADLGRLYKLRSETKTRKGKLRLPQTLNDERGYLQRVWKYFILQGWAKLDPVVVWPRREKVVNDDYPQELTREEEAVLWGCMDGPLYRGILKPAVTIAVYTGLRASVVLGFRLEWIQKVQGRSLATVPAAVMKTRRPHSIVLPSNVVALLPERLQGPLFEDPPSRNVLYAWFKRAVRQAGVNPRLKLHDLRRTFATRLLDAGVPETTVMQLGGWASKSVMLEHYLKRKGALAHADVMEAMVRKVGS